MKNALSGFLCLVLALSIGLSSVPVRPASAAMKSYGSGQVMMAFDIDLQECWSRPLHEGWYKCEEWNKNPNPAAHTARTIEYVWPRTVSYTNFTVPSEGALLMEVVLVKDATHSGWLGYDIQRYDDASAKWVSAGWYWKTLVQIDNGKQSYTENTQYDLGLLTQDTEGKPWHPVLKSFPLYPAGKYRLFAFEPVWGQLDAYLPARGSFTIVFIPRGAAAAPCSCANKDLCKDGDGDGVADWEDLCPAEKGTAGFNGCTSATSLNALGTASESMARTQLQQFLSCLNTGSESSAAGGLRFEYGRDSMQYENGVIYLPDRSMWRAFWRADRDAACTGKSPSVSSGETIFDDLYHEMGHYYADLSGAADVKGAGAEHGTWQASNEGTSFDEGRADLFMNLLAKYRKVQLREQGDYGLTAYQSKIGPQDPNLVEGALTSFWLDVLPSDPCEAIKAFDAIQISARDARGRVPQTIADWVDGYDNYQAGLFKRGRLTMSDYIAADVKLGSTARKYGIRLPAGAVYEFQAPAGATLVYNPATRQKELIIGGNAPNHASIYGSVYRVSVNTPSGPLDITMPRSDYSIDIDAVGNVTVTVHVGSVTITTPNRQQKVIAGGQTFTYQKAGTSTGSGASTGSTGSGSPLPSNSSTLRDYDKSGDSFSFAKGKTCSGCNYTITDEDFFIADRGAQSIIHAFESPGVIDMGAVALDSVKEAPAAGYQDTVAPVEGHTYVFKSRGKYGKIYINDILQPPVRPITEYEFKWAFQPNGTRTFAQGGSAAQPQNQQPKTGSTTTSSNPLVKTISRICPISVAYGSSDAPQLQVFRQFRDKVLARNFAGREVIGIYYAAGPAIVELMNRGGLLAPVVKYCLTEPAALVLDSTGTAWNN